RIYIAANTPQAIRSFDVPGTLDDTVPFAKAAVFITPIPGLVEDHAVDVKYGGDDNGMPIGGALYLDRKQFPLTGALYMSRDGKCLINRAGDIFWTAAAKASK